MVKKRNILKRVSKVKIFWERIVFSFAWRLKTEFRRRLRRFLAGLMLSANARKCMLLKIGLL